MTLSRAARAVIGVFGLLLALTGCTSGHQATPQPSKTPASTALAPEAGAPIADPAALTVTVLAPPRAARGQTVTATFRTRPGSSCQLEVRDAAGSAAQRLAPVLADDQGLVSWSWTVPGNAVPGPSSAFVSCSGGARGQATVEVS